MKPPDPSLGNLKPLEPEPSLTRWAIDHTQVGNKIILNTVEYVGSCHSFRQIFPISEVDQQDHH